MQHRNRVQAPEGPEVPGLRPAELPGSTYVRPATGEGPGNALLRLSQTLGSLRPDIMRLGAGVVQDRQRRAAEEVQASVPLMSNQEVREAYKAGRLPGMNAPDSVADIAARKLAGARSAVVAQEAMKEELAKGGFDWEKGDINAWTFERLKAHAEQFGQDRHALGGFNEAMSGFSDKLLKMRTEQATSIDQTRRQDNVFEAISLTVDKKLQDNPQATPGEIHDAVRSTIKSVAGPRGSQGVPFADADKYVLQKAQNMVADGKNLDVVVGLLTQERTGPDGERLPALVNTASHATAVKSIIHSAAVERRKQAVLHAQQAVVDHDVNLLATGEGKLATLQDVEIPKEDGGAQIVSAKSRAEKAVRQFISTTSPMIAQANRETPAQTFNRELDRVTFAGVDHPVWKSALEAAPKAASLNELTDPRKRDAILSAANLYDQLREKNPLYLKGLVNKETLAFFESIRVAKTLPGKTLEEAADMARRASIDIDGEREKQLAGHYREIENNVSTANPSSLFQRLFGYSGALQNGGYLQGEVTDKAKLFVRLGLSPAEAISKAQEVVKETTVNVNGWVVPKLPGVTLPTDFPQAASAYMQGFIEKYGRLNDGVTKSNIGITYDGAGTFTLVGPNGAGLRTDSGLAHFTLKDLRGFWTDREDTARERIRIQGEERRQRRPTIDLGPIADPDIRTLLESGGFGTFRTSPPPTPTSRPHTFNGRLEETRKRAASGPSSGEGPVRSGPPLAALGIRG